jgi:hypothetical protein
VEEQEDSWEVTHNLEVAQAQAEPSTPTHTDTDTEEQTDLTQLAQWTHAIKHTTQDLTDTQTIIRLQLPRTPTRVDL